MHLQAKFRVFAYCVVLFAIGIAPCAQAQGYRVEGVVRDPSGATVEGAHVELHAKTYSAKTSTTVGGDFFFEHVPEASGTIVVVARGLARAERNWSATAGNATRIDFSLALEPANERVVVTATRYPTLASDLPATNVQITRDNLQATPALMNDDALRQVPGFSIFRRSSSRTANPTTQGVSLRGLAASGSSRSLVLEDGFPLNDPFGSWVYWDRVPVESIASIEIAQEGGSSLYGSDALGGVVQFLTRPAQPAGISLETSYGNQNSPELSVWAGGQKGKWFSTFGGQVFHTDGYILVPESDRGTVDTKAGVSDGTADLTIGRKIGAESEIFARGWFFNESRDNGTPVQVNNTRLGQGALGANLQLGTMGVLTLRFYGDFQTYNQNFSAVASDRDSEILTDMQTVPSQGVGGSAVWSRAVGRRQTLVAGFDEHEEIGRSNEVLFSGATGLPTNDISAGGRQRTLGIFGEDIIQLAPRWLLTISARYDYWRNFDASRVCTPTGGTCPPPVAPFPDRSDNAFSPRLTIRNQITSNVTWDASVYRAFRAPTLNELYRQFRQGNTLTLANPFLIAEQLTGVQAGLAVSGFNQRVQVRGAFFYNTVFDPVVNVTINTTPTLITRMRENLGRTVAPGFEIAAAAHITPQFEISTDYQFVASTVASFPGATPSLVGLWVPQVPRNVLTFRARYTNPRRINFTLDGRMVGVQYDDDQNQFPLYRFFVMNVTASRYMGAGVELLAAVENLFNEKYPTAATPVPQLGLPITARFGLRFQIPTR